jgi:hypothetical protein
MQAGMSDGRLDLPAVTVRFIAVPVVLLEPSDQRGPCQVCDFVAPAPHCAVMRARLVAHGLPDCSGGFIYRGVLL